jgi:hypothetical protein
MDGKHDELGEREEGGGGGEEHGWTSVAPTATTGLLCWISIVALFPCDLLFDGCIPDFPYK